jgi:hypothetical protein
MKVARITRTSVPHLINGGVGSTNVGLSGGSSGQVITSNGSNGYYWGENVARITANSSNTATGPFVNFAAGSNIILAVSSNTINIASTGGGSGTSLTIEEVDASPSVAATKLVFPNGTLGVVGTVATYTPTGGSSGSLVFLEAHTASSSAQLDFTTFISSTYDTYKFELVNLIPASDNVNFYMRVGYGGGPTYDTGGYSYAAFRWSNTGTAVAGATPGSPAAQWDLAGNGGVDNGANYGVWGSLSLFDPQSAIYKKIAGNIGYVDNAGSPLATSITGQWASATAMTAVRFYFASGNIASGLIRAYGVSKS